jgi:hypothetical protein
MGTFSVIRAATKTVASFLNEATGVEVDALHSPADKIDDTAALIHLYLFRVEINPFFRNNAFMRPSTTEVGAPPMGLNLFYLITPYGADQLEIQLTLGEVMSVFNDTPVIPEAAFDAELVGTTEELRVVPHPMTHEQLTELWRSFEERSYRLALAYEVSAVLIDSSDRRDVVPVDERHIRVGTLG